MTRVVKALKWVASPSGRKDIGAAFGTVAFLYTTAHRLGIT